MPGETVGLSSLFHHVDLVAASAYLLPVSPIVGDGLIEHDEGGGNIGLTSGLVFVAAGSPFSGGVFPPGWGRKIGFNGIISGQDISEDEYFPPIGTVVVWAQLPLSGLLLATQRFYLTHAIENVLWDEALPTAISVHMEPGWACDAYTLHL